MTEPSPQDFQLEEEAELKARLMPGFEEWCRRFHQDPESVGSSLDYEQWHEDYTEWRQQ